MRILFLDDDKERHQRFHRQAIGHQVDHAWTAGHAINKMDKGTYDLVYLDHDLDATLNNQMVDDIEDGRFVVRWIVANADRFPNTTFIVHSLNRPAAEHMFASLDFAGLDAVIYPIAWKESPDKFRGVNDAE
jgi:DNA-binding response OmpR family regulator